MRVSLIKARRLIDLRVAIAASFPQPLC